MLWVDNKILLSLPKTLFSLPVPPASELFARDMAQVLGEKLTSDNATGTAISCTRMVRTSSGIACFNSDGAKVTLLADGSGDTQEIVSPMGNVTALAANGNSLAVGHLNGTISLYKVIVVLWCGEVESSCL